MPKSSFRWHFWPKLKKLIKFRSFRLIRFFIYFFKSRTSNYTLLGRRNSDRVSEVCLFEVSRAKLRFWVIAKIVAVNTCGVAVLGKLNFWKINNFYYFRDAGYYLCWHEWKIAAWERIPVWKFAYNVIYNLHNFTFYDIRYFFLQTEKRLSECKWNYGNILRFKYKSNTKCAKYFFSLYCVTLFV